MQERHTWTVSAQPTHAYAIGATTQPQKQRSEGIARPSPTIITNHRTMAKHHRQRIGEVRRHVSCVKIVKTMSVTPTAKIMMMSSKHSVAVRLDGQAPSSLKLQ